MKVLLIEDRKSLRQALCLALSNRGHEVLEAADGNIAAGLIKENSFDVILSDLRLPGMDGLELLGLAGEVQSQTPFVIMTAYGKVEEAVRAIKQGAYDFLTKPVDPEHLFFLLDRLQESKRIKSENTTLKARMKTRSSDHILGESSAIQEALALAKKVATSDLSVLLLGESGTGKELFSRDIHRHSQRRDGPFLAVNCASIPEGLLESELFGHEKGAFTGAVSTAIGKFEAASGGTLFLDEIGDMAFSLQSKILRVLQEKTLERVGGTKSILVDVRIIAATHQDLPAMVREKRFREDLFYRIQGFPINLPALRDRPEDIQPLAQHFLENACRELGRAVPTISDDAQQALGHAPWPGNIRQLKNTMERCAILCELAIQKKDLQLDQGPTSPPALPEFLAEGLLEERCSLAEPWLRKILVQQTMRRHKQNQESAAKELGLAPGELRAILDR